MAKLLSNDIIKFIYEHGRLGREAWERGAVVEAEAHFMDAWNHLPEPKIEYDYAQSMSGSLVTFFRDTRQFDKAKMWLDVMRDAYGSVPNDYVEFVGATVHYEAGEFDEAFAIFDAQFKRFKKRPFEGENKKYLEFYKKRSGE